MIGNDGRGHIFKASSKEDVLDYFCSLYNEEDGIFFSSGYELKKNSWGGYGDLNLAGGYGWNEYELKKTGPNSLKLLNKNGMNFDHEYNSNETEDKLERFYGTEDEFKAEIFKRTQK